MHSNVHYALGIIIASLANLVEPLSFWTYGIIVFCAFGVDFDIFASKYANDGNHRTLITHSIFPAILLFLIGILSNKYWILFCALSFISHILFDMIDWGVNIFHFKNKLWGIRILWKKMDVEKLNRLKEENKNTTFFFTNYYYQEKTIWFIEILCFLTMVIILFSHAIHFWYFILGYFAFVGMHYIDYSESRNRNMGNSPRFHLIREK